MPEAQARAQTAALTTALDEAMTDVVQTSALERLEGRMTSEFDKLRADLRVEIAQTRADFSEKLRIQGWAVIVTNAALLAAAVALLKLTP